MGIVCGLGYTLLWLRAAGLEIEIYRDMCYDDCLGFRLRN